MSGERVSDSRLSELINRNNHILGPQRLDRIVTANQRFNHEVTVHQEDGTTVLDSDFELKKLLAEIPGYVFAAGRAGLNADQSTDLVVHTLNAQKYDFLFPEMDILLLGRAFDQEGKNGNTIRKGDLSKIRKMISFGAEEGVLDASIYGFTIARKIGLPMEDSIALIMSHPELEGIAAGYSMPPFNEALHSISIAKVDPELVLKTFRALGGKRPWFRTGAFRTFENVITFGCPAMGITPQEIMQGYFVQGQNEDISEYYSRILDDDQDKLPGHPVVEVLDQDAKNSYFISKNGELEHAALPYMTKRSLREGVDDLAELALARGDRWETVGEGSWVFAPESEIWYSLGGRTDVEIGRVRHNYINYDISQLSSSPFLFHIHPADLEIMLQSPTADFPDRKYRDHLTKFLSSTPSRADYENVAVLIDKSVNPVYPRSFIVHSLGVTEFTYPLDVDQLKQMATDARDIRDRAILAFPWRAITNARHWTEQVTVVKDLVEDLNYILPEGFSIRFHPSRTPLRDIIR